MVREAAEDEASRHATHRHGYAVHRVDGGQVLDGHPDALGVGRKEDAVDGHACHEEELVQAHHPHELATQQSLQPLPETESDKTVSSSSNTKSTSFSNVSVCTSPT